MKRQETPMHQLEVVPCHYIDDDAGKIVPNACVLTNFEPEQQHLVIGTRQGQIRIFKLTEEGLLLWKQSQVHGAITSLLVTQKSALKDGSQLIGTTCEGTCFWVDLQPLRDGVEEDEAEDQVDEEILHVKYHWNVPMNVSAIAFNSSSSSLVMGTRDSVLYAYAFESTTIKQLSEKNRIQTKDEVETLQQNKQDRDRFVMCLASGQVQQVSWDLTSVSDWNSIDSSEQSMRRFVLDSFKYSIDETGIVHARLDGQISLISSKTKETLWSTQLPEAIVAVDVISQPEKEDVLIVCTWSGWIYCFRQGHGVKFCMPFPATFALVAQQDKTVYDLICISTSGQILIYTDLLQSIRVLFENEKRFCLFQVNTSIS